VIFTASAAGAVDTFVPKGHTYAPGAERLPALNSPQDRRNAQTDIYESEIYRIYRERALHEAEMLRLEQHDMKGGMELQPRY
jgi:hypothetical protein